MAEDKSFEYLSRFNNKFLAFVRKISDFAPDLLIVEDELSDLLAHGNPEIVWAIFKDNILTKYKTDIYQEENKLFEEDMIMTEIFAFASNKDNSLVSTDTISKYDKTIRDNIHQARDGWMNSTDDDRKKLWNELKLLVKLCELYTSKR